MADLVLDLGGQGELPAQGRGAHDPVALGEDAHQLAVGVHLDEAQDARPVLVGHPVAGLDLAPGDDVLLERAVALVVIAILVERQPAALALGQDGVERQGIGHRGTTGLSARRLRSTNSALIARADSGPPGRYQVAIPLRAVSR